MEAITVTAHINFLFVFQRKHQPPNIRPIYFLDNIISDSGTEKHEVRPSV